MDTGYPNQISYLLQEGSLRLKNAGIPEPKDEADILLAYVIDVERWKLFLKLNEKVCRDDARRYFELISKREEQCPVAYLTGHKEFYGLKFFVSPKVLIPRPETELLVDTVLDYIETDEGVNIIDLGTGSGAVAVSIGIHRRKALLWAVDISSDALHMARKNAKYHEVDNRISFMEGSYWESCANMKHFFNIVISNPPYISHKQLNNLPRNVAGYEPRLALNGGPDGLEAYRKIITGLALHLVKGNFLVAMEVGEGQSREVAAMLKTALPGSKNEIIPDLRGIERVVMCKKNK